MRKFTIDLTTDFLEKFNISMNDLIKYKYKHDEHKKNIKKEQNKRYYLAHKERIKKKNLEAIQKQRNS